MKKKIALLGLCGLFSFSICTTAIVCYPEQNLIAYAEEEEEEQPAEQAETEEKDEVKEWFDNFFSPDKVAMYLSWIAYIGTIIGLVANIRRLKQSNNLTLKNVSDEVQSKLEEVVGEKVAEQFEKIAPKLVSGQENTNKIMSIFAKILALSQENTPESKLAILNLIEELGVVSQETIDCAKEIIEEGKVLAEEAKKELDKKIDEIVDSYDGTSI